MAYNSQYWENNNVLNFGYGVGEIILIWPKVRDLLQVTVPPDQHPRDTQKRIFPDE